MNEAVKEPWADDEIEFLSGDWEIRRAEYEGLYNYSVNGIWAHASVDAVQLIEWKMARLIKYEALTPQSASGIAFVTDTEIMRDVITNDVNSYIINEGSSLACVNMYYLIKNGYAVCGDSTERVIARTKVNIPKSVAGIAWPNDKIILTPPSGCSIERAYSEGRYKVTRNGASFTRTAEMLINEGLAKSLRSAQLDKLATYTKTSMSRLKSLSCDFWYSNEAEIKNIKTLRDIARLWHNINYNPDVPNVKRLTDGIDEASRRASELTETVQKEIKEAEAKLTPINDEIEQYKTILAEVSRYVNASIFTDFDKFESIFSAYYKQADNVNVDILFVPRYLAKLKSMNESSVTAPAEIKTEIFPSKIASKLKSSFEEARKTVEIYKRAVEQARKYAKREKELFEFLARMRKDKENVAKIGDRIYAVKQRKDLLDQVASRLSPSAKKAKKHLFNRTYKSDNIKYVTAIKIKHKGNGIYEVPYDGGTIAVTADELIYLNLAKRI